MENAEKTLEVINDLIEINNDRVEGFEKAGRDLEGQDSGLTAVFNKLAGESRQNARELSALAQQYGGEAASGTSTSGALHRAWMDIKSTFTGSDLAAVLNECERGEDAIKSAYKDALEENDLEPELAEMLQKQQQGITEGHDLIKSMRDQAERSRDRFSEGNTGQYQDAASNSPELEDAEQEEAYQHEQTSGGANSKLMEFFIDELKDLFWAENELVDTLPDMAEAATSQELKTAFTNHLAETEVHVSRLEKIFGILGLEPDTTKCDAMAGIVDEGDSIISNTEEGTAQRDVGLIFAGQKAEHYEIASYGGMVSLAKTLGYYEIAELLVLTLDEEKTADGLLTEIAENHVNYDAGHEPSDD